MLIFKAGQKGGFGRDMEGLSSELGVLNGHGVASRGRCLQRGEVSLAKLVGDW